MSRLSFALRSLLLLAAAVLAVACTQKSGSGDQQTAAPADSVLIELAADGTLNVLQLLEQDHAVQARGSAMGAFVTAVDTLLAGNGYFWIYSVNDTMPSVAADRCVPQSGDIVRWHFRRPTQ